MLHGRARCLGSARLVRRSPACFGPLLGLPDALADATPYALAPSAPADPVTAGPLLALTAATAAVGAIGLAGLRRRDITP